MIILSYILFAIIFKNYFLVINCSIDIKCNYTIHKFDDDYNLTTCKIENKIKIRNESEKIDISTILTSPLKPSSNDVEGFEAAGQEIFYLPQQIGIKFGDLKALQIRRSKMRKICTKVLESFLKLKFLDLRGNEIKILEENLFRYNKNLVKIHLSNNRIFYIDSTAFDDLQHLKSLDLNGNACYSKASGNASDISENLCVKEIAELFRTNDDKKYKDHISFQEIEAAVIAEISKGCNSTSNGTVSNNLQDNMLLVDKSVAVCVIAFITALLLIILTMVVYISCKIRNLKPESSHYSSIVPKLPSTAVNHPKINEISIKSMNMSIEDDEKPEPIYQSEPNIYEMTNELKDGVFYSSPIEEDFYSDVEVKNDNEEDKELYAIVYKS